MADISVQYDQKGKLFVGSHPINEILIPEASSIRLEPLPGSGSVEVYITSGVTPFKWFSQTNDPTFTLAYNGAAPLGNSWSLLICVTTDGTKICNPSRPDITQSPQLTNGPGLGWQPLIESPTLFGSTRARRARSTVTIGTPRRASGQRLR